MDPENRFKRLRFRAWHRGTKEADMLIGGFFDAFAAEWSDADLDWYETLLEEEDADILAWVMGTLPLPDRYAGPMFERMRKADYVQIAR